MYNEEDNIPIAVSEALRVGKSICSDIEVIIVNDASTDKSGEIVDRLALIHDEVKVVHHKTNRKLGGALKSGFAAASKEFILYIDSDLPIKMDDILLATPLLKDADVVIGWRKSRAESKKREIISFIYNRMIRFLFDLHVKDVNFAFKLFKRSFYDNMLITSEGSFIDAELLLELQRAGAIIKEIGMDYYPRVAGLSTLASNSVIFKILSEMYSYKVEAYGKRSEDFTGKRRRLWLDKCSQQRNTVSV